MAEHDPLTQQYLALWELLEKHEGFANLVQVGNRARLHGDDQAPIKEEILPADLPEVRVQPAIMTPHIQRTSSGSSIRCGWQIVVATGDWQIDQILLPLEWEIYRAMANWASVLSALTWRSQHFVKITRASSIEHGAMRVDLNRGIKGWYAIWACETESYFQTALLLS